MNLSKVVMVLICLPILAISDYFYSNKALSFRFVDEQYNFAIGKYLTWGERLYDDIITNHQPLTHILSFQVQQLTKPNSTYLLVVNHRKAIILWATIWSLILVFYFGVGAFVFVVLFELTKIYLLGNIFLTESWLIYPLVTLSGLILFIKRELKAWELIFWGICFALVLFSLSPLWPLLLLFLILINLKQKQHLLKSVLYLLIGFSTVFIYIASFTSFLGYLHLNFVNLTYTVPTYHQEAWILTITKSFLTPFFSFFPQANTPTLWVIRILSLVFILEAVSKLRSLSWQSLTFFFIILGLTNIRFVPPGTEGYAGFHLLPWYATFVFLGSMVATKKKGINFILIFSIIVLSINFAKTSLFTKNDKQREYYINYSTHTSLGEAVKIMKNSQDTLFVSPDAWLVYWQSDTNHLPKLFGYYTWMVGIPSLNKLVLEKFEKNPPTFFYCENCKGLALEKYLSTYQELKRDGGVTNLYVLPDKIKKITLDQKAQLEYHHLGF